MERYKPKYSENTIKINADTKEFEFALNELEEHADRLIRKFERLSELASQLKSNLE